MRTCEDCAAEIPPQRGSARPRKFCERCRPPRNRRNPRVIELPEQLEGAEHALVASYRQRLRDLNAEDTPEGCHLLLMVQLLAHGRHTAAGAAALSREVAERFEAATRGRKEATDRLDELERRRRRRVSDR